VPEFFAAAQSTTTLDMVALPPGLVFDKGDAVRGFGGTANELIDGRGGRFKDDGPHSERLSISGR